MLKVISKKKNIFKDGIRGWQKMNAEKGANDNVRLQIGPRDCRVIDE